MPDVPWDIVPLELSPDLMRRGIVRHFAPHQDLCLQGHEPAEIFAIVAGRIKVWRVSESGAATTLLILGPGEVLGTVGMLHGVATPVSASAIDAVTTVSWPIALFREAMVGNAALASDLLRVIARRAGQLIDRLDDLAGLPVEERLARLLLRLSGDAHGHDETLAIVLKLRQQDLADMCFSTVPTISRTLAAWEKNGLVEARRGRIRILHLSRLAAVAGLHLD